MEERFLKIHYEPEHTSGGVCWCGVSYHKIPNGMEIKHKEQRKILVDFIHKELQTALQQRDEEIEENSLARLIEKCGDNFYGLFRKAGGRFIAFDKSSNVTSREWTAGLKHYNTPEEAIKNIISPLNTKE